MMTGGQSTVHTEAVSVEETEFDPTGPRGPVEAVVEAIAAARHTAPTEIAPIHDSVDADALNRIFAGDVSDDTVVEFTAERLRVVVRGDGRVRVRDSVGDGAGGPR